MFRHSAAVAKDWKTYLGLFGKGSGSDVPNGDLGALKGSQLFYSILLAEVVVVTKR